MPPHKGDEEYTDWVLNYRNNTSFRDKLYDTAYSLFVSEDEYTHDINDNVLPGFGVFKEVHVFEKSMGIHAIFVCAQILKTKRYSFEPLGVGECTTEDFDRDRWIPSPLHRSRVCIPPEAQPEWVRSYTLNKVYRSYVVVGALASCFEKFGHKLRHETKKLRFNLWSSRAYVVEQARVRQAMEHHPEYSFLTAAAFQQRELDMLQDDIGAKGDDEVTDLEV